MARCLFRSERCALVFAQDDESLTPGALVKVGQCPFCSCNTASLQVVRLQGFYDDGCRQLVTIMSCCRASIDFDEWRHDDQDESHVLKKATCKRCRRYRPAVNSEMCSTCLLDGLRKCPYCGRLRSEPGRCLWTGLGPGPEVGPVHHTLKEAPSPVGAAGSAPSSASTSDAIDYCDGCGVRLSAPTRHLIAYTDLDMDRLTTHATAMAATYSSRTVASFLGRTEAHLCPDCKVIYQKTDDPVSHPAHYTFGKFEVIEVIDDWGWGLAFSLGNSVKYIARAGRKDPKKMKQDLEKARWYLDHAISLVTKGE